MDSHEASKPLERVGLGLVVGLEFMVRTQGLGFRVKCLGFTMLDFRVQSLGM
jgi:hypothetical protein